VISATVALHQRDLHKPSSGGLMWAPAMPDVYRHSRTETCTLDIAGAAWVPCPPASEWFLLWLQGDIPWVRSSLCDSGTGTMSLSEASMLSPPAMMILEHCHRGELHGWSLVIAPVGLLACAPSVVRVTHGAPRGRPLLDFGSEPA